MVSKDLLNVVLELLKLKSEYLYRHCLEVGDIACLIGRNIGLDSQKCVILKQSGYLHDLGKLGISDMILMKPGGLTEKEMEQIRLHPYLTVKTLKNVVNGNLEKTFCEDLFKTILYHHEDSTGNGYYRKTSREIPLLAKILRIADVFSAVYELKLQNLSKRKSEVLRKAFLEAKWLYNWLVSDTERLRIPANKVSMVKVKAGDIFEQRELNILGSQIKQEIADRLKDNLRVLGKLKKNGCTVGALKYKKFVNSIPLQQYGVTYSLEFAQNRVRIQRLGKFRVLGLHQIPTDAEIANAVLVRKPSGYYLHVTCYLPKNSHISLNTVGKDIGIDFGVSRKLTLSNGIKIDFEVHETPRLKRLQRKLAKTQKGSRNRERILFFLRKEYEKLNNRRKDAQNRILAFLKIYRRVAFQDDWVKGWSGLFGRQVHSSGIGGLKSRLRTSLETPVAVERMETTTRMFCLWEKARSLPVGQGN